MNENAAVNLSLSRGSRVLARLGTVDVSPALSAFRAQRSIEREGQRMWKNFSDELREVVWLASVVGGLTVVAVGMAVALAAAA